MTLHLCSVLAALFVTTLQAKADLIHAFSGTWGDVTIDLNVFDGQPGGRYLWEYTVHNNGYGAGAGQNGFSGFELFLPTPIPEIADITPNGTTDWEINCCSGNPVEWDKRNSDGDGVLPGETGVFSFTTDPRAVAINDSGWYHTWVADVQTDIIPTIGMHVPFVPGLTPIPDGGSSFVLLAMGALSTIVLRARRPQP